MMTAATVYIEMSLHWKRARALGEVAGLAQQLGDEGEDGGVASGSEDDGRDGEEGEVEGGPLRGEEVNLLHVGGGVDARLRDVDARHDDVYSGDDGDGGGDGVVGEGLESAREYEQEGEEGTGDLEDDGARCVRGDGVHHDGER